MRNGLIGALAGALLSLWAIPALATGELELTFLGNEGFLFSNDESKVIIDGFISEPYALYEGLTEAAAADLENARGLFADIDVALASHRHFDHFQPDPACAFMKASPSTLFVTSPQVKVVAIERCKPYAKTHRNLQAVNPVRGVSKIVEHNGVTVEIFPLSHGVGKYAVLENFGQIITIDEVDVLHLGDAAMDPADFLIAGLQNRPVEVALIPYWYLLQGAGKLLVNQYIRADILIAVHIPPDEFQEVKSILAEEMPEVRIFDQRMTSMILTKSP